jgi:S-adenosylmethionine decarboxylase
MSKSALAGIRTKSFESAFQAPSKATPLYPVIDNTKDYFVERDGVRFAGMHLLVELWEAEGLDDPKVIEDILCRAAEAAEATVLHSHMHHFSPYGGVSGVVVLAESHISIHTWPERAYAAIDIFMCGTCDPHKALPLIRGHFKPGSIEVSEHRRGVVR